METLYHLPDHVHVGASACARMADYRLPFDNHSEVADLLGSLKQQFSQQTNCIKLCLAVRRLSKVSCSIYL